MTRTADSLLGAAMVLSAIMLSPYTMLIKGGCQDNPAAHRPDSSSVPVEKARPAIADEPPVVDEPPPHAASGSEGQPEDPEAIRCVLPDVNIPLSAGCDDNEPYPACRWSLPDPEKAAGIYEPWRYSTKAARWGRPALVTLVLAAAAEYARLTGGEKITVGDLDAPGERHKTHDRGVDVDLYLPGRMATENKGKGVFTDNYTNSSPALVQDSRAKVELLARILATCSAGELRIYYNDPPVIDSFLAWFAAQGMSTPFDRVMMPHNDLHLFHFHVTIAADLEVLGSRQ
jgi:hypothetical protein